MPIQSPIHSLIDFEQRLEKIVLSTYHAQFAFQFLFSSDMEVPRDDIVQIYVAKNDKSALLFLLAATVQDVCFWGKLTGIDLVNDSDFPIVIAPGEIIADGTYAAPSALYAALQALGFSITNNPVFLQCCTDNLQDYTINYTAQDSSSKVMNINFYRGLMYVDSVIGIGESFREQLFQHFGININDCYRLFINHPAVSSNAYSNSLKRTSNTNYLTFLSYYNNESALGFRYPSGSLLINKMWMPLYTKNPTYPEVREVYKRSNQTYKVTSAIIDKQWDGETDYMPDELHRRIVIALGHDNVHFLNSRMDEDVFKKDEYNIGEPDKLNFISQAKFKVLQNFEARNSNCEQPVECVSLPEPPGCVAVTGLDFDDLPNAVIGQPYYIVFHLGGSAPFALSDVVKPSWMTISISGSTVVITGTTTEEASDEEVSFTISNCEGDSTVDYSSTITVNAAGGFSVVLIRSGDTLTAIVDGGTAPYHYVFSRVVTGPCPGATIDDPDQTIPAATASTGINDFSYFATTNVFQVTVTDSTATTVNSNTVTVVACLVPETRIMMRDGSEKMLDDIKKGDELFDSIAENITEHFVDKLYVLNDGLLKPTESHINLVNGIEEVRSCDLKEGAVFKDWQKKDVVITKIEIIHGKFRVKNLSSSTGKFIANGILTHNKTSC